MPERTIQTLPIDQCLEELKAIPDFAPGKVSDFLRDNRVDPATLQPYTFFSPTKYTRNLIFKNDLFEVLALGWGIGQVTAVHNHDNQRGWITVISGKLKAQNYRVLERNPQALTCKLEPTESGVANPGDTATVDEDDNVHQILNLKEWNEPAVSLHIYSKPHATCEVYHLDMGTYTTMQLSYTSMYGKRCGEETVVAQ